MSIWRKQGSGTPTEGTNREAKWYTCLTWRCMGKPNEETKEVLRISPDLTVEPGKSPFSWGIQTLGLGALGIWVMETLEARMLYQPCQVSTRFLLLWDEVTMFTNFFSI